MMPTIAAEAPSLLRLSEVLKRTGLGRSSVYALIQRNAFPSAVRVAGLRASLWSSEAISAWVRAQVASATEEA